MQDLVTIKIPQFFLDSLKKINNWVSSLFFDEIDIDIEKTARQSYDIVKNKLLDIPDYCETDSMNYPYLDLTFYDNAETYLKNQGFKLLGNYTMANWKSRYTKPTFIRSLVKDDMIVASIWHHIGELPQIGTCHTKVVEYETLFSNHCAIQTTPLANAEKIENSPEFSHMKLYQTTPLTYLGKIESPPEFMKLYVNPKLSPGEILQIHLDRVSTYQREQPAVTPRLVHSLPELFVYGQQQAKLKADYRRKSLGGILSKEEFQKLAPYPLDDQTIERIRAAMTRLAQEDVGLER